MTATMTYRSLFLEWLLRVLVMGGTLLLERFNSLCEKIKRTWFKVACDFVFYSHISEYKTDSENDNGKRRQDSAAK